MNLLLILLTLLALFFVLRTLWLARPDITPEEVQTALKAGSVVLIDVREPVEWSAGVAQPAVLLSFSALRGDRTRWREFLEKQPNQQFVLYCASGTRSGMAAAQLRREGFKAANLGGVSRWSAAGLPMRRPG